MCGSRLKGPKRLRLLVALALMSLGGPAGCGRHKAAYVPYPGSPDEGKVWADIAPLIAAKCGGKSCHSEGSVHGVYAGDRRAFLGDKKIIIRSLFVTKTMPKNSQLTPREQLAIQRFYENH